MTYRTITAVTSTMLLLALAACSNSAPEDGALQSPSDGAQGGTVELVVTTIDDAPINDGAFNDQGWSAKVVDGKGVYESAGSGSCPPIVNTATLEGGVITLNRTNYAASACTMDYRPYKQEITRADGEPLDADVEFVAEDILPDESTEAGAPDDFVITDLESSVETSFDQDTYYDVTVEDGGIVYTAGGAGGCPPVIESAEYRGDSIALIGKDWGDGPCEESYVVIKQRIAPTDGTLIASDTEIVVEQPSAYYNN